MRLVKKFVRDDVTEFVSRIFDEVIIRNPYPVPFNAVEFHIRDNAATVTRGDRAIICINYNNPLVLEKDARGVRTLLRHELFRLMLNTPLPRTMEDVVVGREMIKRGFGDDLFYMYYNMLMHQKVGTMTDFVQANIPWIVFRGIDNYNSTFLQKLMEKMCRKKFPEVRKFLNYLCNEKFDLARVEYRKLKW